MSDYIYMEIQLVFHSFLLGLILMVSYDFLRLFRLFIPHGKWWTGVEDFIYCLYCAWMVFCLLFYENSGIVRWYVLGSAFLSMILYDRIISQSIFGVLKKIKRWITMKKTIQKTRKTAEKEER